jgi:hypothetical protein
MARIRAVVIATLLGTLLVLGPAPSAQAHQPVHPEWGHLKGHNGVLRTGCHTYHYRYWITPPDGLWAIETFITGPGLKHLAAGAFLDGYDPEHGRGKFILCSPTTHPGRFKIRARLSVQDGQNYVEGWLPPAHFHLRAPR